MKILLEENIPVQLKNYLPGHMTAYKNIYAQQNLVGRTISILVLPTNRRKDVLSLSSQIVETVTRMHEGQ